MQFMSNKKHLLFGYHTGKTQNNYLFFMLKLAGITQNGFSTTRMHLAVFVQLCIIKDFVEL